ncbi:MAG: hypothetical protein LQ347_006270 [Umbilicaria vellea]|nr:MAG: hypothetical protein LQ347_006270 [Umbilicaria vellea]
MEDLPPTYAEAVSKDPWRVVASYLQRAELRSLCLVSRAIRKAALPALWSQPDRHFGNDTGDIYTALYRFTECVETASPEARQEVHTFSIIDVAPAFVSWSIEQPGWLHSLLENLPDLQSLLVHRSSVINQAVVRFLSFGPTISLNATLWPKTWYLHVLSMTGVANVTPDCLGAAMACFPQLVYLDLSYSNVAGKYQFIQQLCGARLILTLKILKLRGVGLGDRSVSSIATSVGAGLWSLDVGENNLTDVSIQALLDHCFLPPDYAYHPNGALHATETTSDCAQDDGETYVLRRLSDCQRNSGLTHLRIPNNDVSAHAIINLVKASRLLVLDCSRKQGLGVRGYYRGELARDAEQVVRILRQLADDQFSSAGSLNYLRINHQLVTGDSALLDTLDKDPAATSMPRGDRWPRWLNNDFSGLRTETALPTMGLRTLVLTGLPYTSQTGSIAKGLVAFLNHCAGLEFCATETAVDFQNSPKHQNTSGAQSEAETSNPTSLPTTANPPQYLTKPQDGAEPECPPCVPTLETPEIAPESRTLAEPSNLEASRSAVQCQPQAPQSPSSNPATAPPHPSTRTTLRSIYLEIDRPPPVDPEAFDMHKASRGDFSFFETDTAAQDQVDTDNQPEENPWRGDLIPVLRAHKARAQHVWSGSVFAVYE